MTTPDVVDALFATIEREPQVIADLRVYADQLAKSVVRMDRNLAERIRSSVVELAAIQEAKVRLSQLDTATLWSGLDRRHQLLDRVAS